VTTENREGDTQYLTSPSVCTEVEHRLARGAAEHLGLGVPTDVCRLRGGLGRAPILFTCGSRRVVVKQFGHDRDAAQRELVALARAAPASVATPAVLASDERGNWSDGISIAMSWVPGKAGFPVAPATEWIPSLAAALVAIHDLPPGPGPVVHPTRLFSAIEELRDDERFARVAAACAPLRDTEQDLVFAHGDFHPGNVLFTGSTVTGVIDWADSGVRPRASDVAYCRGVLAVYPGHDAPMVFLDAYEEASTLRVDCTMWDALWGARGMRGAYRHWPAALASLDVDIASDVIWQRSAAWVDHNLEGL